VVSTVTHATAVDIPAMEFSAYPGLCLLPLHRSVPQSHRPPPIH
jgi:hypothetical protein